MNGNVIASNALNFNASKISKCNKWCIARCEPHPGQLIPKIKFDGQRKNTVPLSEGLLKKK